VHVMELHSLLFRSGPAYVDPGSGSIAIQLFLAAMLSTAYTMRTRIGQLMARFRRKTDN